MTPNSSTYAVVSLDGRPRCWSCGSGTPRIDGKYCCPRCELNGRRMFWADPTPEQISERAAQIRSTWPPGEEMKRRIGTSYDGWAANGWQPPHMTVDTILAATQDRAAHRAD